MTLRRRLWDRLDRGTWIDEEAGDGGGFYRPSLMVELWIALLWFGRGWMSDLKLLAARGIRRIFVLQGTVIGVIGTLLGSVLGGAMAWALDRYQFISLPGDVYFVDHLPVELSPLDVGLIVGASILISFLATIYPSRRAADLAPVQAIRHE